MLNIVNRANRSAHVELLRSMHADRKRIFVDWLGWDVPHDGRHEADEFDGEFAEYLILKATDQRHLASVRLLRTEGSHLLGDVFPHLCDGVVPRGPHVREITRLCISPECRPDERRPAMRALMTALVEHGLLAGIETYTAITDTGLLSRIIAVGWRCRPLGMPQPMGNGEVCALQIDIDKQTLVHLKETGRYTAPIAPLAAAFAA